MPNEETPVVEPQDNTETQQPEQTQVAEETPTEVAPGSTVLTSKEEKTEESKEPAVEEKKEESTEEKAEEKEETPETQYGAPETYADFGVPEDSLLDANAVSEVLGIAREMDLSQEQAEKLVEIKNSEFNEMEKAVKAKGVEWLEEVKKDPELGGQNFEKNAAIASKMMKKFGNPDFDEALEQTQLGNYKGLIKFVVDIGKHFEEDSLVKSKASASNEPRDTAERLYPKHNK